MAPALSVDPEPVNIPAEPRVLRPRRAGPADIIRPTRAEVNLEALRFNFRVVKRCAGRSKVWAVLKADAYGHGAPAVARTLECAGAAGFCVALLEEAVELREAGIMRPILVMGGYYGSAYEELLARQLTPVVYDRAHLEGLARLVRSGAQPGPVNVHLKIDTGMARLGVTMREIADFAQKLRDFPEVRVHGLMTHFASADAETLEETTEQMVRFDEATAVLLRAGVRVQVRHAANSAALLRGAARLDWVRPGIALFGVSPRTPSATGGAAHVLTRELKQVMRVRTEVIAVRDVDTGVPIGYGGLWRATRPSRIGTIPMGYADGLSRAWSNHGEVLVRGRRAPLVGAVSMDMSMVDVTDVSGVAVRDEAVVMGNQEGPLGRDTLTADELAARAAMIPWEVLCAISRRVPRFYREP